MYGYKNVYESYYEHQCSAETEKDVLHLDIWGKGVIPRFKRWWHDLFLLSYSDSRSKLYYMSSHAMMSARTAHFRNNRGRIHPFSKFSNAWNCLMLQLRVIHVIFFHLNTTVQYETHVFFHYLLAGIEYIFILNVFINTRTGYAIEKTRRVIMRPSDILVHYLSTNAFIHVLCSIPLQNLRFLRVGNTADATKNVNLFVCTLKIVSTFHIIKLFQVSKYLAINRDTYTKTMAFRLVRIIVLGLAAIVEIKTLYRSLSIIRFIMKDQSLVNSETYLENILHYKYASDEIKHASIVLIMITRILKSFFLFGYGLQPHVDVVDQMTAMSTYSVAFIFHFWAAVVVYNYVVRINYLDDTLSTTWCQTWTVLCHRKLPNVTHKKVKSYYDYRMAHLRVIEKRNILYRALPIGLKREIKISCYSQLVAGIPCFSEWPQKVISEIVGLLKPEIYLKDDVVSGAGAPLGGLLIVEAGLLAVYSGQETGQETGHLADGDHIGESALSSDDDAPSVALVAVTSTGILVLDKVYFRKMMTHYPEYLSELDGKFDTNINTVIRVNEEKVKFES